MHDYPHQGEKGVTCLSCGKRDALYDVSYGWLPCTLCQSKHGDDGAVSEFTSAEIKEQRKAHGRDIVQPHRKGKLSKEFVDAYGADAAKKRGFSDKEINHAKPVWDGYYGEE
jgi:hypothetical protein